MIPRYSRPEMAAIWAPENRFRIWFEIERMPATRRPSWASSRKAPPRRCGSARLRVERIDEIERETKHDVIAFLTNLAEHVGPEARFVHQGMTSSDVLDTCLGAVEAGERSAAGGSRRAAGRAAAPGDRA